MTLRSRTGRVGEKSGVVGFPVRLGRARTLTAGIGLGHRGQPAGAPSTRTGGPAPGSGFEDEEALRQGRLHLDLGVARGEPGQLVQPPIEPSVKRIVRRGVGGQRRGEICRF
jgi:hypothetical protein